MWSKCCWTVGPIPLLASARVSSNRLRERLGEEQRLSTKQSLTVMRKSARLLLLAGAPPTPFHLIALLQMVTHSWYTSFSQPESFQRSRLRGTAAQRSKSPGRQSRMRAQKSWPFCSAHLHGS
jgi:hypothetical protein